MTPRPFLRRAIPAVAAALLLSAAAADPADRLGDHAQEARARALFRDVRCLVCQSQSIDESDAELARDLRQVIRAQVAAGRTDAQIRRFLVSRYGQFVLLTPRLSLANAVLWAGPLLVVVLGGVALAARGRGQSPEPSPLSSQEEAALENLRRDETV
jgi:cytochrome c-type biogenesis protein CcmH